MPKLQEQLQSKLADQEGRVRRENVRIYGVPEGAEDGPWAVIPFVERLLKENLELPDTRDLQIQRAHRALAPQPPTGAQPRSILVKFLSFRVKEEVLKLAWQKKGFSWRNCKINLDHDYALYILARRREYAETRRALKEKDIKFQTLYPARLRVFHEDGTKTLQHDDGGNVGPGGQGIACKSYCTTGISSREDPAGVMAASEGSAQDAGRWSTGIQRKAASIQTRSKRG